MEATTLTLEPGRSVKRFRTTVPEGAPPVKLLFDRLTPVIACDLVTVIARLDDVLAPREVVGIANVAATRIRKKKRNMAPSLTVWP